MAAIIIDLHWTTSPVVPTMHNVFCSPEVKIPRKKRAPKAANLLRHVTFKCIQHQYLGLKRGDCLPSVFLWKVCKGDGSRVLRRQEIGMRLNPNPPRLYRPLFYWCLQE